MYARIFDQAYDLFAFLVNIVIANYRVHNGMSLMRSIVVWHEIV